MCHLACITTFLASYLPAPLPAQEPHKHQVEWLASQLPDYAWVGKGRCPVVFGLGEEHCEYNPVFYDTTQVDCGDNHTMWLSDMPSIPNTKFQGSAFPRIATWAR